MDYIIDNSHLLLRSKSLTYLTLYLSAFELKWRPLTRKQWGIELIHTFWKYLTTIGSFIWLEFRCTSSRKIDTRPPKPGSALTFTGSTLYSNIYLQPDSLSSTSSTVPVYSMDEAESVFNNLAPFLCLMGFSILIYLFGEHVDRGRERERRRLEEELRERGLASEGFPRGWNND